ncbi:MAG: polymerase [Evtepia sp.]|jgi:DNA polymerase-1|nr:polymerase [Evtepia sp.]
MKLLAIDGNSIVNRAFYGIRPLSNHEGFPTNAIYGFLTILQRILEETSPDALCITFDRKDPTFRHESYDGYKAQRQPMPEELAVQIPKLKEVLDAMNIPRFELAGWEADDLLGTISRRCEEAGWSCIIATGDKDALQLITDRTYVYLVSTRMGKTTTREMDPMKFREAYGFEPTGIVDLKALMGDASDNIPGVRGIGEKTGMALIQAYGTIENLYAQLDTLEVKPAVLKKLAEGREAAWMSHDLATIRCNVPMDLVLQDTLRKSVNQSALYQLFLELEFTKMIEQMGLHAQQGDLPAESGRYIGTCHMEEVTEPVRLSELLSEWEKADYVALLALPDLAGVAVSCNDHMALLFRDSLKEYDEMLSRLFSPQIKKVGHGIKELMKKLLEEGYCAEGFLFDTEVAAYLLAPTDGSYELEHLARTYFPQEYLRGGQEQTKAREYLAPNAFSPLGDRAPAVAAFSSHCALIDALFGVLSARLEQLELRELFETVELPLCSVLAEMERDGFLVDRGALQTFGETLRTRINEIQAEIYEEAGEEFNINSTQQLGIILFEQLGLPPVKKTKTGYSTSIEVLEKLQGMHPIIDCIMEYRQLSKLNSTYVEGLTKVIAVDGRIHTCFQNTVTATGRLSSTEPNLQNIPVRTPLGAQMRNMFVAPEGKVLVDADYSQIELRLLAHIAKDENMIDAFQSGADIHTSTAAQVFGVEPEQVTSEMRRRAKAVNFGIVYGISEFSLAQDIGVTRREAGEYMEKYFSTFQGVRNYMYQIIKQARQDGYVKTLMGRRRWLPELQSSNYNMRSFGERVALNMPIQGTAADVMKLAMIKVRNRLKNEGLQARLVLQVHDELIVECPIEEARRVKELLKDEMESAALLSVPLKADAAIGKSWGEAKG